MPVSPHFMDSWIIKILGHRLPDNGPDIGMMFVIGCWPFADLLCGGAGHGSMPTRRQHSVPHRKPKGLGLLSAFHQKGAGHGC